MKLVKELNEFEQGQDPYKNMDLGKHRFGNNIDGFVENELTKLKNSYTKEEFYEGVQERSLGLASDNGAYDLYHLMLNVLKQTPIEYQQSFWADEVEWLLDLEADEE
jgi:hypothetical protein